MTPPEARRVQRFVKSQGIAARVWAWLTLLSAVASLLWLPAIALLPAFAFSYCAEVVTLWFNIEYLGTLRRVDRIARDEIGDDE